MTVDMGARYAVAESLLAHKLKELIDSPQVRPIWIDGTETFWYIKTTKAGKEFVLVDAEAGTKRAAFDHARLANALEKVLEIPVEATALPIPGFELRDGSVRLTALGKRIEVSLDSYEPRVLGAAYDAELPSPDGRWSVGVEAFNLFIRDLQTGEVRQLTTDGTESVGYGKMPDFAGRVMQENLGFTMPPLVLWSPDSSKFVTYRLDQSNVGMMHLLRAVPFEGIRPKPMAYRYALPGDPDETLATSTYHIFEAATGAVTAAKKEPVLTPFVPPVAYNYVWWNGDGTKVFFINSDRGDKNFWLNELDVATGDVQVIHHETSTTHITLGAQHQYREARVLDSTGEILWWSQR